MVKRLAGSSATHTHTHKHFVTYNDNILVALYEQIRICMYFFFKQHFFFSIVLFFQRDAKFCLPELSAVPGGGNWPGDSIH